MRLHLVFLSCFLVTVGFAAETVNQKVINQALSLPFVESADEDLKLKTDAGELSLSKRKLKDRSADLKDLKKAIDAYKKQLQKSKLSNLAKDAVVDVIDRIKSPDKGLATDQVNPAFARRLVQHGWLNVMVEKDKSLEAVSAAVSESLKEAMELKAKHEWKRASKKLQLLSDAWGSQVWVLSDGKDIDVATRPAVPMYDSSIPVKKVWVHSVLPKDADLDEAQALRQATEIKVISEGKMLASWSDKNGFKVDGAVWREVFKIPNNSMVDDYFPPHIIQQDLNGDIYRVIVADGILHAPKDDSKSASTAFLDEAAKVMKDAAHMDLIGQYLVKYVYDSPETAVPFLIGNRDLNGDIHQTAHETLSTVTGGVCRGDCDDVSELYQQIAERQNKLGHVVMLPGHAAFAFAEKKGAEWDVIVLQTGPALSFNHKELPKALEMAYKHFGATETFDANGLGLLLRFSNEKTRGPWRLGWRIFSDRNYAETMIDIQKDWHFQTYLQGIKKMQTMLKDEKNHTPANYREIASLYAFTGQWDKFVENHQKAVALTKDKVSLLEFNSDYINTLFDADRKDEAVQAVNNTISDLSDQELRKRLGDGIISYGLKVSSICASNHQSKEAVQILDNTVTMSVVRVGQMLNQLIAAGKHKDAQWTTHPQMQMLRRIMRQYVAIGISALTHFPEGELPTKGSVYQITNQWLSNIAHADAEGPTGMLNNYSVLGNYLALTKPLDEIIDLCEKAEFPSAIDIDHKSIFSGGPLDQQIAWIKASSPFWAQEILQQVSDKHAELSVERVVKCDKALTASLEFVKKHKLDSRGLQIAVIQAQVAVAMLEKDNKRLKALLKSVKERDDKWLRDGVAALMGNMSRHIKLTDYKKAIEVWIQEVNYKPKYYWIAWRAALSGSPKHALYIAQRAAEIFHDDKSFVEEYNYMKEIF